MPPRGQRTQLLALASFLSCLLCETGCGRIGFDALEREPAQDGAAADASTGEPSFKALCDFATHVIIENGIAEDDSVGRALANATRAECGSSATIRMASQDDPSLVDTESGRPLSPSDQLIVLGGGDGPHDVVRYLLRMDTPLIWGGSPLRVTERATNRVVAEGTTDNDNDFILLQVIREPIGGTTSLSAQGNDVNGTLAAALYFEKSVGLWIMEDEITWVVLQWSDTDGTPGASADDTYEIIESG